MLICWEKWLIGLVLLLALLVRLPLLTGPLDEPMWRQADTAYMAARMMRESPPDMLRPKAPFRGTNDVKAAEFPVYPALVAVAYKAVGRESLFLARVVTMIFFCASIWFLWAGVRRVCGGRVAAYTAACYAVLPLGVFYSRAVHPDYSIIWSSHVLLYGALRYFDGVKKRWFALATGGATLAFLMKAPYAFYFALPVAVWLLWKRPAWRANTFLRMAALCVLPVTGAIWFNQQRLTLEAGFDESLLYPMKWTAESLSARFFGTLAQRLDPYYLKHAIKRLLWVTVTPAGVLLCAAAPFAAARLLESRARWTLAALCVGVVFYIALIFPMFARAHDYYHLPLLAPVAILIGLSISWIATLRNGGALALMMILILVAGSAWGYLRVGPYLVGSSYGTVDWQRVRAGEAIRVHTNPDDIVLSVTHGRSTGWSDPRILFIADRRGWAIEARSLNASNLAAFVESGASMAAVLVTPEAEAREHELGPLAGEPHDVISLQQDGRVLGTLRLYALIPSTGSQP